MKADLKTIAHILPWEYISYSGGTENYVLNIIKYNTNYNHIIFSPGKKNSIIHENNYKIIKSDLLSTDSSFKFHYDDDNLVDIISLFRREQVEICHFHCFRQTFLPILRAFKLEKFKLIHTPHLVNYSCSQCSLLYAGKTVCDGFLDTKRCTACIQKEKLYFKFNLNSFIWNKIFKLKRLQFFKKRILSVEEHIDRFAVSKNMFDLTICLSNWYKNKLTINDFCDNKIVAINQDWSRQIIKRTSNTEIGKIGIIYVGRREESKGYLLFMKTMILVNSKKCSITILGKKNISKKIRFFEFLVKLKFGKSFIDLGLVSQDVVAKTIKKNHILCVPSIAAEMSPLIIKEAKHTDLLIVGSDDLGIKELIANDELSLIFRNASLVDMNKKIKMGIKLLRKFRFNTFSSTKTFENEFISYSEFYNTVILNNEVL